MELSPFDGIDHFFAEHEIFGVRSGYDYPLGPGKGLGFTHLEISFNLLIDTTDGLDFAFLINGTGDGNPLFDGDARQAGKNGIQLGGRGAVTIDAAVALFKGNADGQIQRIMLGECSTEVSGENQHPLVMSLAA